MESPLRDAAHANDCLLNGSQYKPVTPEVSIQFDGTSGYCGGLVRFISLAD